MSVQLRSRQKLFQSPDEMMEFAKDFAKNLKVGETLALSGDLGSGKTIFTKGLALGLGIKDNVTSPTFVLMKQYALHLRGVELLSPRRREKSKFKIKNLKLIHIDCYRMKSSADALSIGLTDYLGRKDSICVIEWPERIAKLLPKETIYINFEHVDKNRRKISIIN